MSADFSETDAHATSGFDTIQPVVIDRIPTILLVPASVPVHLPRVRANPSDIPARRTHVPSVLIGISTKTVTGTTAIVQCVFHNGIRKRTPQQLWRRQKVLRLLPVHQLVLRLLGPLYEKIYNPSG